MKKIINFLILAVFLILALTFAYKNEQLASINYYANLSTETEMYKIVFGAFAIGLILGYIISMTARLRTRGEMKKAQQQAKDAQQRLDKIKVQQNEGQQEIAAQQ